MNKSKTGAVLVLGGGIAGIQSALDLADSGFKVYMVEESPAIGGKMAQLDKTFPTNDCSMCIISPKLVEAGRHLNIELLTRSEIESIEGEAGNFRVRVKRHPRFIEITKCTSCGECAKVCPIELPNEFDEGLSQRKATYKLYPQGMPSAYAITKRGTAPCKGTCPAHVSIQGYIALINQGRYREALELFKDAHPFPGICGRVCHHPCEGICTRNDVDEPLAIRYLHRFLADYERESGERYIPKVEGEKDEKVAVIGSGPAGLSCAYFLRRKGYKVEVFEKLPVLGGMMAVGIPEYRLPRDVLREEIEVIKAMGVEMKVNMAFGKDITLESLKADGFKAVFLAIGLHVSRVLGVPNEGLPQVIKGVDFLREVSLGKEVELGKDVVVIGGGNVAIDVALTALREGAKKVRLVCLEQRHEMPAWEYEIEEALEEGVEIINGWGPKEFIEENGKLKGILFKRCISVFDEQKRFNPKYDESDLMTLKCDNALVAIGQAANLEGIEGIDVARGGIKADPLTLQTNVEWVFAGGDVFYGPKSVVEAVECGKEAAISIERFLEGKDLREGRRKDWSYEKPDVSHEAHIRRVSMPQLPVEERKGNFKEIALGFSEEMAREEARRCLKCGICSECYQCVKACLAGAVNHEMAEETLELEVGSIILAPGFEAFDPSNLSPYGYGRLKNVVTSLEFERILSASGPYQGHLVRPFDHKEPKKIAWLQCVGSRDINRAAHSYCSSVCCMYAIKQALIAKEHAKEYDLETSIFYMDMRTYGKEFERYLERAQKEKGVRFLRCRVHSLEQGKDDNVILRYTQDDGVLGEEIYDMVVLSVGMEVSKNVVELCNKVGIDLNEHSFLASPSMIPVSTNIPGIYACGAFCEPKDIPSSVMEASSAASLAGALLSEARGTLTKEKDLPPERDVKGETPRIGVFVCNCGINIGGVARVSEVVEYAKGLPFVVHAEENLFTCSQDTQDRIKETIKEKNINRVVVASCSPRTHEPLFQETIREAGLNPYLFEMANIRDQGTWVHMSEPDKATEKAKDLVRMAVSKALLLEPLYKVDLPVKKAALVVGGGIAGMEAALGFAQNGIRTCLVERSSTLGGIGRRLRKTWDGKDVSAYIEKLVSEVSSHPLIEVYKDSQVVATGGIPGDFRSTIRSNITGDEKVISHGATVLATGGTEYRPKEFSYGQSPKVLTHLELDELLSSSSNPLEAGDVVFIQCVGSRNQEFPYCSKVCCTHTVKAAVELKTMDPHRNVVVLYRDIRTYGLREDLFMKARKLGVIFTRFDLENPPTVIQEGDQVLVRFRDHILDKELTTKAAYVVLAAGIRPNPNKELFELFKVPVNADGFLVEAHPKLRPVDFASEGIFMAGLAHYPKAVEESIAQARAAVSRAMTILSKDFITVGGVVAEVFDPTRCARCLTCVRSCPYGVPYIKEGHAHIDKALCHGCGVCAAECPAKIITLRHFTDEQIISKTIALPAGL